MKTLIPVMAASVALALGGCDVFIGNTDRGQLLQPCFEDGVCAFAEDLECLESADVCVQSCSSAINELYDNECAFFDENGNQLWSYEAIDNCHDWQEQSARCGCLFELTDLLICLAHGGYGEYSDTPCSSACRSYFSSFSRCLEKNGCEPI
ncbi:MAG: hypothetical protein D6806_10590 [Deltaproteobacteria bacterium]|nr:MAG: hypothetical protein D6806_10590 [Deltaproteobacteria bacterium]